MRYVALLISMLLLVGCAAPLPAEDDAPSSTPSQTVPETSEVVQTVPTEPTPTEAPDPVRQLLNQMTLEERVGQLFFARCQPDTALTDIQTYHLGGFVLFASDFEGQTPDSFREKVEGYQSAASIPLLLGVDEEGGTVTRVSRYPEFREEPFPSPQELYREGGCEAVAEDTEEKCALLKSLGINVNFAPVCDVSENPEDFIYERSFGQNGELTAEYVRTVTESMSGQGVACVLKHFPGYGDNTDTHTGVAYDERSYETFETSDFLPFRAGIESGAQMVLVSHNIVSCMDSRYPASLSSEVHKILREELEFSGVIVTDDLVMDGIRDFTSDSQAAVLAVQAGNDLLCCTDFETQIPAVTAAVEKGEISEERIDESVQRILEMKISLGLIEPEK